MVSMRDVALHARVSLGTVSKFFNAPHRVAPETSERIAVAVRELGFVRNEAARQLRSGRSRVLAFVALELNNPFFGEVAEAMELRSADEDLFMSIVASNGDAPREGRYLEMLVQQRVFGVILASGLTPQHHLDLLHAQRVPTVLMDAWPTSDRFSSTAIDDYAGARAAVQHLVQQGATRIAVVGGEPDVFQIGERVRGARAGIEGAQGVSLEVIPTHGRSVAAGRAVGEAILARRPEERPDGVFAANDLLALGVMGVVAGIIDVPRDLRIVGYDDIDFAQSAAISLSSVRRPPESFGRSAVDLILDQAEAGPDATVKHISIQPELVARASSLVR
jgi:LacI family transcriptional regulator